MIRRRILRVLTTADGEDGESNKNTTKDGENSDGESNSKEDEAKIN